MKIFPVTTIDGTGLYKTTLLCWKLHDQLFEVKIGVGGIKIPWPNRNIVKSRVHPILINFPGSHACVKMPIHHVGHDAASADI